MLELKMKNKNWITSARWYIAEHGVLLVFNMSFPFNPDSTLGIAFLILESVLKGHSHLQKSLQISIKFSDM